jgi:dCTP deaminase
MTTLNDTEIAAEMAAGRLVVGGHTDRVFGASYELRVSNVYYDLTESDRPVNLSVGETILIKPGHRVVLITEEELNIPIDFVGRVVSKGSLFSVGLSHVATYADPGFSGNLGIVTQNISDKYIVLPQGQPIAKIDFTRLSGPVNTPYQGQHGFRTQIWPIKHQFQKSYSEVAGDNRVGSEIEEGYRLLPHATAQLIRTMERHRKGMEFAILLVVIINGVAIFLVGNGLISNLEGLAGNLVASAICYGLGSWVNRSR